MSTEPQSSGRGEADDPAAVATLVEQYTSIRTQLSRVIVGQEDVVEQVLVAMFARGHCILEGVPGLAKTLLVSTLSKLLSLSFSRIQFTPDLMPSDITGTEVIEEDKSTGTRSLRFVKGAVFANVILADEINRTPPKTQAALLEAMQECQVTAAGFPHKLPQPFFVLATQNPIEQEGTYPLPEAQLDRFMFKILVDYPGEEEELDVIRRTTSPEEVALQRTLGASDIMDLQQLVRRVPCADHVMLYAARLARATRTRGDNVPPFVREYVAWGAGPRASQYLVLASKARAILDGRHHATIADVRHVAYPVLRHRILMNFNAEAEAISSDDVVTHLIETLPSDPSGRIDSGVASRVFARDKAE